jgi:hypothetical protein
MLVKPPSIGFTWKIEEATVGCGNGENNAPISIFFGVEIWQLRIFFPNMEKNKIF